jgi:hypothetical protein
MEQLKQILQKKNEGIALWEIARRTGISRNGIKKYLALFDQSNPDEQCIPTMNLIFFC